MPSGKNTALTDATAAPGPQELEKTVVGTSSEVAVEDPEYPSGLKLVLLTISLCLSVFLMALVGDSRSLMDTTSLRVIATAIPHITDQFHSLDDVGWYGSAYLLTHAATQLLFGKFYTFLPVKWVFVTAITLFEAGSLLCGAAPNSNAFIVGRALAGVGSSGIFSGAMIIISRSVPLAKRPMYTGIIGGMYGISSVAGPLMGGVFTDKVSWRWCFYINLPIGAVTLAVVIFIFKMPRHSIDSKSTANSFASHLALFDPHGTLVFIPAIVSLLLALQWGGSKYPWNSWRIILLFVFFGILISIFVAVQLWKGDGATIPPRIIKKRSIWSGVFFAICSGGAFMIFSFWLPIWFQAIHGVSAIHSGIDNLPMILSLIVTSVFAGALITWIGYYTPLMILSSNLSAIGAGLLCTLNTTSGHTRWFPYEVICGVGIGLGMQQPLLAAQAVLDLSDVPVGTSLIMFAQTLGGAIFVSIGQNVFTNKLVQGLVKNVPGINPMLVLGVGATDLRDAIDPQFFHQVLEVYNQALVAAFYVAVAMACLSLFGALTMEWTNIKGKKMEIVV
ncbi:DHA14-like major facilitator [Roridomyces roridus]|uniref:DHA14-like major facilitator n=1 Tax=Roridomyces roridus TaxID=1738132 RepID=A0AAD7CCE1_9AGAR|nr:DHA14-like major facilitator [Roridomyces roridus]